MNSTLRTEYMLPQAGITAYQLKHAMENHWIIHNEQVRAYLEEYYLLYHAAAYIRSTSWQSGCIIRNNTRYHAIFYGACSFSGIKFADCGKQFALSFREPRKELMTRYSYLVPTVLIADPTTITLNGRKLK